MRAKRWTVMKNGEGIGALAQSLGLSRLAAGVLGARGYDDPQKAAAFLDTSAELSSPFLLKDMDKACERIMRAVETGEKAAVYGDYDADGVTSTYVLCHYLSSRGLSCRYRIPDRQAEGYGMSAAVIDELRGEGVTLVVTVDNGITALDEVAYANSVGIDVIVTDHHECRVEDGVELLPAACAVVNPHRAGDEYPFKALAGVGVVFQLVSALEGGNFERVMSLYGDAATVGTVADVMRIVGENRAFVARGLREIADTKNLGLQALLRAAGGEGKKITAGFVGFVLAPRINAAGRMSTADSAAELFLCAERQRAEELAKLLCDLNKKRQNAENEAVARAVELLSEQGFRPDRDKSIVLWSEEWNGGIVGIVSARLVDRYGVPTVLFNVENGKAKGSGRSVAGFNLHRALASVAEYAEKFGGHEMAAGLTVAEENLEGFKRAFAAYCENELEKVDIRPELTVDLVLEPADITTEQIEGLAALEPFGNGWPSPVFALYDMTLADITPVGCDKHLRLTLERDGASFTAMMFGVTPCEFGFAEGSRVDAAFHLDINEFRGTRRAQLVLRDVRYSKIPCDRIDEETELYFSFIDGEELEPGRALRLLPAREDFVAVWRYVKRNSKERPLDVSPPCMCNNVRVDERREIPLGRMLACLSVFEETGLIGVEWRQGEDCGCHKSDGKPTSRLCRLKLTALCPECRINLGDSTLMQRLEAFAGQGKKEQLRA